MCPASFKQISNCVSNYRIEGVAYMHGFEGVWVIGLYNN
jgi:hypothetical protein